MSRESIDEGLCLKLLLNRGEMGWPWNRGGHECFKINWPLFLRHVSVNGNGWEVLLQQQLGQGHAALHALHKDDHLHSATARRHSSHQWQHNSLSLSYLTVFWQSSRKTITKVVTLICSTCWKWASLWIEQVLRQRGWGFFLQILSKIINKICYT